MHAPTGTARRPFGSGWTEMVAIAAEAARTHKFDEKNLRLTLAEIAHRSHGDGATVNEEGWKQGVAHSMADGISSPRPKRPCSGSSGDRLAICTRPVLPPLRDLAGSGVMRVALMQEYGAEPQPTTSSRQKPPRHNVLCDRQDRRSCPIITG